MRSVRENLLMGSTKTKKKDELENKMKEVLEMFPWPRERLQQEAGSISGGEQQMLAISRGLMASPKLLMMVSLLWGWPQSL